MDSIGLYYFLQLHNLHYILGKFMRPFQCFQKRATHFLTEPTVGELLYNI